MNRERDGFFYSLVIIAILILASAGGLVYLQMQIGEKEKELKLAKNALGDYGELCADVSFLMGQIEDGQRSTKQGLTFYIRTQSDRFQVRNIDVGAEDVNKKPKQGYEDRVSGVSVKSGLRRLQIKNWLEGIENNATNVRVTKIKLTPVSKKRNDDMWKVDFDVVQRLPLSPDEMAASR